MSSLKSKVLTGVYWESAGRFSSIGIQFAVTIIIARILTPQEFGIIGLLVVFMSLGQILLDSGFSQALIQKKNASNTDLSSVYFFNIGLGFILYILFYFLSPIIANFYSVNDLTFYSRVLFIILPINSLGLIQNVILQKELNFKKTSIANILASIFSGIIGVVMAYSGYGVWSLIGQQVALNGTRTLLFILQRRWVPELKMSIKSIKELFAFSAGLMGHSLVGILMKNIYTLVIGKFFPLSQVGLYTQANKFQEVSASTLTQAIIKVSFPALVLKKDNTLKLQSVYKVLFEATIFFIAPLMFLLSIISESLFRLLLTDKWLPAVPYFQILCVYGMLLPMLQISYNLYKLFRKSKLLLTIDLIRHLIVLTSIFLTIEYGIETMLLMLVLSTFFMVLVNLNISGKLISLSFSKQVRAYIPYYIISALVSVIIISLIPDNYSDLWNILLKTLLFTILYLLLTITLKLRGAIEFLEVLRNVRK